MGKVSIELHDLVEQRTLDHGYVRYIDHLGDDNAPLEAARMSTGKETGIDVAVDNRLRERLWEDQHTSPTEMCELVVEVCLPLFVLQQFDRHRTVDIANGQIIEEYDSFRKYHSENEFSGRYATMPDTHYQPRLERFGKKGVTNKQGTAEALPSGVQMEMQGLLYAITKQSSFSYTQLVEAGVSSEVSRFALIYTQYTKTRLKANLLNWLKFLNLRLRPDVQLETRIFARQIARVVRGLWPRHWELFEEHTLYGERMSRSEMAMLQDLVVACIEKNISFEEICGTPLKPKAEKLMKKLRLDLDKAAVVHAVDLVDAELPIPENW